MTADVAIVANGGANIASLRFALDRLGATSELTSDPDVLHRARRVILPGVGAAGHAMARLHALQLVEVIPTLSQPVLGICLGMQLLFESSDEDDTTCLGLIPARVTRLEAREGLPPSPLLRGLEDAPHLYFVHSYAAPLGPWTVATTGYGTEFASVVQWRNFHGAQCHPERSSQAGLRLLANFLALQ
jgi:glutamine amidotransferase